MILKRRILSLLLVAVVLFQGALNASELTEKLKKLGQITRIDTLRSNKFPEKYLVRFQHPLDYDHPEAGTFEQRVVVAHRGFDRPTVVVTEGYGGAYAHHENYTEELAEMLQANLIHVEYRYFLESTPKPCRWEYLTVWNSLQDLHDIVTTMKGIYPKKWLSTGISKGGMTCIFYRAYFPNDVDVSVPYVAPLNKSVEDGRHEIFLEKEVGTPMQRRAISQFQTEILKRKKQLMPAFEQFCHKNKLTFHARPEEIFDYCVLEFPFAYWQWGRKSHEIPAVKHSTDSVLLSFLLQHSSPDYFQTNSPNLSFFVQAAKELGYYGYDTKPLQPYLTIKSSKDYLRRIMLPDSLRHITFSKELYKHTVNFLKKEDVRMIFIYGENDPWSASGVHTWLDFDKKKQMKVYVDPCGSHISRIGTLAPSEKAEAIQTIKEWMQ